MFARPSCTTCLLGTTQRQAGNNGAIGILHLMAKTEPFRYIFEDVYFTFQPDSFRKKNLKFSNEH